jgi:hypothetical protein
MPDGTHRIIAPGEGRDALGYHAAGCADNRG